MFSKTLSRLSKRTVYSLAAALALVMCAALAVHSSPESTDDPRKDASARPVIAAADHPTKTVEAPRPKKLDPRDAWAAAVPRMIQADRESIEAAQKRLASITQYLDGRKAGARPFAEEVLSLKGKLLYTGGLAEQAVNAIGAAFGAESEAPNAFNSFVRDCYRQHIVGDETRLQKVINEAIAGYAGDVKAIEAQLLVDLRADLADDALTMKDVMSDFSSAPALEFACDQAVEQAVDDAGTDFAAMIVTSAVSWVASDIIGNQITKEDDPAAKKLAANVAAGVVVDKLIEGTMTQAGYDPVAKVAARAVESLDDTCWWLIEGDSDLAKLFPGVLSFSMGHPSERVRAACSKTVQAVERSHSLGLRPRLYKLQLAQSLQRRAAIYRYIFGPDVKVPDQILHLTIGKENLLPDDDIIRDAGAITSRFGGGKE